MVLKAQKASEARKSSSARATVLNLLGLNRIRVGFGAKSDSLKLFLKKLGLPCIFQNWETQEIPPNLP